MSPSPNGKLLVTGLIMKNNIWMWPVKAILKIHDTLGKQEEAELRWRLDNLVSIYFNHSTWCLSDTMRRISRRRR
jgi:hypothetical protein